MLVLPHLGEALLPEFKERDFLIHWITKPGTSLPEERRTIIAVSKDLRAIPGVRTFGSHIGQALLAEEIAGSNFGENWVSIDPSADYDETVAKIQEAVDRYPGLYHDLLTYFNERVDEVLEGTSEAIVVRIFGQDLNELRDRADEVKDLMSNIPGVVEEHVDFQEDVPQIDVKVDLALAQRYGIKPGDVRRAAATLMSGEEVGDIFRDGKAYDVLVWSTPETRNSLSDIRDLLLDTPGGGHVRLSQVADVRVEATPNAVEREGDSRRIDVAANVEGRDLGSVVNDIKAQLAGVRFPARLPRGAARGIHRTAERAEPPAPDGDRSDPRRLPAPAGRAPQLAAGVDRLPGPAHRPGRRCAGHLHLGGTIPLGSLVGFFTVLGIAARTGIMMINHFQHLEQVEGVPFGPGLVLQGPRSGCLRS